MTKDCKWAAILDGSRIINIVKTANFVNYEASRQCCHTGGMRWKSQIK